jgi:hypothetical protein
VKVGGTNVGLARRTWGTGGRNSSQWREDIFGRLVVNNKYLVGVKTIINSLRLAKISMKNWRSRGNVLVKGGENLPSAP